MSLKRKRGAGAAVLDQAQKGGSIARTQYVNHLQKGLHPRNMSANMHAYLPHNRSGFSHVKKSAYGDKLLQNRNIHHHHHLVRKYHKGKDTNPIKGYFKIIQ